MGTNELDLLSVDILEALNDAGCEFTVENGHVVEVLSKGE